MQNGNLKEDGQGGLVGVINTLQHDLKIQLKPYAGKTPDSPAFEVFAMSKSGSLVKVGAAWEKTIQATGEIFYSLTVDDVSFSEPLNVTAFKNKDAYGVFDIVWRRPRLEKVAA